METILRTEGISKAFFGSKVVTDFHFELKKGSIHALLGHNGAGKSTFLKILSGAHKKDAGTIWFDGQQVEFSSPRDAMNTGIQMVYQELDLIPYLSGSENIFLGQSKFHGPVGLINHKKKLQAAQKIIEPFEVDIDLERQVKDLNISKQQIISIAKAINTAPKVLILDEPTSTLNEKEVEKLFRIMKTIVANGTAVILITHRLEEVFAIADEVTVMRDGRHIFTKDIADVSKEEIIRNLTAEDSEDVLATFVHKEEKQFGEVVLNCENLSLSKTFRDISFQLHRGEILGLTGLVGCGVNELIGSLFGEYKYDDGHVEIEGKKVKKQTPAAIAKLGVAYVPDDRKVKGLNTIGSVQSNIVITVLSEMGNAGFVRRKNEEKRSEEMVQKLDVKVKSIDQLARTLSGGNQQKVVLAKWLQKDLKILLLSEPTRGIDAAAKKEIHDMITRLAEEGLSILLVSSELEEIIELSDNVIVLYEGEITGRFSLHNSSKGQITGAMYGERAAI